MTVIGSGQDADADIPAIGSVRRVIENDPTIIVTDPVELAIVRCLKDSTSLPGATLTGTWSGQPTPVPLAYAAAR
jgi:hypothetical protein